VYALEAEIREVLIKWGSKVKRTDTITDEDLEEEE